MAKKSDSQRRRLESGYEFFNEINIIAQLSANQMQRVLPHGLTMPQFSVLNWFTRVDDEATPGRLARAFQVTKGAMTNTLQRLEEKGCITVIGDPQNGRSKLVRITPHGRQCRDEAVAATFPEIERFLAHVSQHTVQQMLPLLREARSYLDAARDT
jgi:DNA-binding MarR family transcriptional regulator